MERSEVISLFKLISSFYTNFEVSTEKVNAWTWAMKDMDFDRVTTKAKKHVQENKFPPTIAEVAAYAPEHNEHLDKMKQWEKDAAQVPEWKKQQFKEEMQRLIREKSE